MLSKLKLDKLSTEMKYFKMQKLLIKWLDKMISVWEDTMPYKREDEPETWDNMQADLKELKKLRKWAGK